MDLKNKEIIDSKRRSLLKKSAVAAIGLASTQLIGSIGLIGTTFPPAHAQDGTVPKNLPPGLPPELFDNTPLVPTKVFDNLYCIGSKSVVSWALTTSAGIILIDSMWDNRDGKLIIDGLKQLGLNPADIKHIIVTHGHGDHYGGAQFIKDTTNAEIFLGKTDIEFMRAVSTGANGPRSPKPRIVSPLIDGQRITLGDTTVTAIDTPGHTPGCISLIYPVKQSGQTYMAAQWGGTGAPRDMTDKLAYRRSIDYFEKHTKAANATVKINAHLFADKGYEKLDAVKNLQPGEANPWIIGKDGMTTYFQDLRKYIGESIEKKPA